MLKPMENINPEEFANLELVDEDTQGDGNCNDNRMYKDRGSVPLTARPFVDSIFPVLLLNPDFTILYANPACNRLFTGYFCLEGNLFSDVFGKAIGSETLRELRETLITGKQGYSWKGVVKIKTHEAGTLLTKLYLFPALFSEKEPKEFIILFDDVTDENRRLLHSVFVSLLEASKLKDNDTGNHIIRVNRYSHLIAQELHKKEGYEEIDRDFIEDIGFLASMHDVGKIGTPDDILNKEGPLMDWEWSIMREHTKNGAFILSTYPNPMAREIALSHHEKWEGTGYPFQLEGRMIPLSARIVEIADVYDALRMKRSYKKPFDHETALMEMKKSQGTHFDPNIFDVFLKISGEFEHIYMNYKD